MSFFHHLLIELKFIFKMTPCFFRYVLPLGKIVHTAVSIVAAIVVAASPKFFAQQSRCSVGNGNPSY